MIDLSTATTLRKRAEAECPELLAECDRLAREYNRLSRLWGQIWEAGMPDENDRLRETLDARRAYQEAARRLGAALR